MRNMNVGDKAFFYHSNCKEPAIVGTMEIVKEFSEDSTLISHLLHHIVCSFWGSFVPPSSTIFSMTMIPLKVTNDMT